MLRGSTLFPEKIPLKVRYNGRFPASVSTVVFPCGMPGLLSALPASLWGILRGYCLLLRR